MDLLLRHRPPEPRFYVTRVAGMSVVHDRLNVAVQPSSVEGCVKMLNALDDEVRQLRYEDAEWWTLAAGGIAMTPNAEASKRVEAKCQTLLRAFYERGKRAGREEVKAAMAEKAAKARKRGGR